MDASGRYWGEDAVDAVGDWAEESLDEVTGFAGPLGGCAAGGKAAVVASSGVATYALALGPEASAGVTIFSALGDVWREWPQRTTV